MVMRDFENNSKDIQVAEKYCNRMSRLDLVQAVRNPLKFRQLDGWDSAMLNTKAATILCSLAEDVLYRRNQMRTFLMSLASSAITGGLAGAVITYLLNKN
jgi:hypothetical protein